MLYGVTRIVNFAHGEIIALGAIATLFFSSPLDYRVLFLEKFSPLGLNFAISCFLAILVCGLFGGLLEVFLFRPLRKNDVGNIAVLVVTIGLSILVRHLYLLFAIGKVETPATWIDATIGFLNQANEVYKLKIIVEDGSVVKFFDENGGS